MAHNLLLQADDLLKQMGLEARGTEDAVIKRDLLGKVSVYPTCFWIFVIVRGRSSNMSLRGTNIVEIAKSLGRNETGGFGLGQPS
jgi:hypothetical protein